MSKIDTGVFDELIFEEVQKARKLFAETGKKPKMLLHVCCAICASHVVNIIHDEFDLTIFYYNPNIHPEEEYKHRFSEVQRLVKEFGLSDQIDVIEGEYNTDCYFEKCSELAKEKEGGARCSECFYLRLKETALYAKEHNFDMFATTLTISPHKNSKVINEIGKKIEEEVGVHFACSDFKKKEGFKKSNELAAKYNIYRQNYCGCTYSAEYLKEIKEEDNAKD